jgi:hypothetical protein
VITRGLLGLLAVLFTLGGIAAGASAAILVSSLGGTHGASVAVGITVALNGWVGAFLCAVLASVHSRLAFLEDDVAELEHDLTTSDGSGTLGG